VHRHCRQCSTRRWLIAAQRRHVVNRLDVRLCNDVNARRHHSPTNVGPKRTIRHSEKITVTSEKINCARGPAAAARRQRVAAHATSRMHSCRLIAQRESAIFDDLAEQPTSRQSKNISASSLDDVDGCAICPGVFRDHNRYHQQGIITLHPAAHLTKRERTHH